MTTKIIWWQIHFLVKLDFVGTARISQKWTKCITLILCHSLSFLQPFSFYSLFLFNFLGTARIDIIHNSLSLTLFLALSHMFSLSHYLFLKHSLFLTHSFTYELFRGSFDFTRTVDIIDPEKELRGGTCNKLKMSTPLKCLREMSFQEYFKLLHSQHPIVAWYSGKHNRLLCKRTQV